MPTAKEWDKINEWVEDITKRSKRLYVGRTNFPERRLLEHRRDKGLNKLFALHWAKTARPIEAVEVELIKRYSHLERLENRTDASLGRWGEGPHCVYVAWVWTAGFGDHEVKRYRPGIVGELPAMAGRNRYLSTALSRKDAGAALDA